MRYFVCFSIVKFNSFNISVLSYSYFPMANVSNAKGKLGSLKRYFRYIPKYYNNEKIENWNLSHKLVIYWEGSYSFV